MPVLTEQYLEAAGVALLAAMGVLVGSGIARLRGKFWLIGYLMPLVIITAVAAARRVPSLEFVPPFSLIMYGRTEFIALGFACAALLTTVLTRLPRKREKAIVSIFMAMTILYLSVLPFALPPLLKQYQSNLATNFDSYGVCLQSNYFNCGAAAAVTALKAAGISAREGEIAVLAQTNPASGTQPDILNSALASAFGEKGLSCEYRSFESVEELKDAVPAIALIGLNPVTDHHVAVLKITEDEVILGDPLEGKRIMSHAEFEHVWRHSAIVVKRNRYFADNHE